jgi:imidazoleglycerol phosphate synthase glutamine amidotransferase subunit HisH
MTAVRAYLVSKPFVYFGILLGLNLLLEESKEDGDHQACFQGFTENDEEDGDGKHVGHLNDQSRLE